MIKKSENRFINLKYLLNNSITAVKEYLKYNGTDFNDNDIDALIGFVSILSLISSEKSLKQFTVGYKIERLDKEFDLIKMDDSNIINIELKLTYEDLSQAADNYKILSVFNQNANIYVYCYCKHNNKIYFYNKYSNTFIDSTIEEINEKLENIIISKMVNFNFKIFSIYKNPNFFIKNEFCLSISQKTIFNQIINNLNDKPIIIQGDAGVGKSLLALYLHKELSKEYSTVYLAPIKIFNIIDESLIKMYNISTVKSFLLKNKKVDYIIVDEAQNLGKDKIKNISKLCNNYICFGDRLQDVKNIGYFDKLCSNKDNNKVFNMKKVIRTDNTFVTYAKKVLNIESTNKKNINYDKIDIKMSDDTFDISDYVYIEPLKSIYFDKCTDKDQCTHQKCINYKKQCASNKCFDDIDTCSLEFDKVVIYICDSYKLKKLKDKKQQFISIKKSNINNIEKELYLMMTRAISNLLIITDDIEIYNYLMSKKQ